MFSARPSSTRALALARAPALALVIAAGLLALETEPARGQSSEGQSPEDPAAWQLGARAELISSAVTSGIAGRTESLRGLGVAASLQRRVGGPGSVRIELAYLPRGVRQELLDRSAEAPGRTVTAETRLHYLSLPAFVQAGLEAGSSPVTLTAFLGPRLDVLIGSSSGTFSFSDGDVSAGLADRYDTVTIGASGGLGVAVVVGAVTVTADVLQHRDITAPVDEGGITRGTLTIKPLRNVATSVSVGVRW